MDNIFPLITPIVYPVSQKKIVTIKNMKEAETGELEVTFLNIQFIKCEELLLRDNHKQED
jgi:hypothetical protein